MIYAIKEKKQRLERTPQTLSIAPARDLSAPERRIAARLNQRRAWWERHAAQQSTAATSDNQA